MSTSQANYLAMSDEEFLNQELPTATPQQEEADDVVEEITPAQEEPEVSVDTVETSEESDTVTTDNDEAVDASKSEGESGTDEAEAVASMDYKSLYERITAPFKANGKEIQVTSPDEAIQLMQMGANYSKKMSALKPSLKVLKMLEKHEMLDEERIGFLIDLGKKNPEAIKKLVKDSGIDLYDLESQNGIEYKPTDYSVDEREMRLNEVLDEIQHTESYPVLIDTVSNRWDVRSRDVLVEKPELLRTLSEHKQAGIFDTITTEIERQRIFGKLEGMSDLEAYKFVGDSLYANKGTPQGTPVTANEVGKPEANQDPQLSSRKHAASSPRGTVSKATASNDLNPLAMSDADFEKQILTKFL